MPATDASERPTAAVVTVGSELTTGLRLDTNSAEIALALTGAGYRVAELVSIADDAAELAEVLARLTAICALVIVTGGLGPTHDDITREAASRALSRPLARNEALARGLEAVAARHAGANAAAQVFAQAEVLEGARVLPADVGTAPGQIVLTPAGSLVLLPGPPREMRPMLAAVIAEFSVREARPLALGCTGTTESDAQFAAQRALARRPGIGLTVLARPGDVQVVLFDEGAGEAAVLAAAEAVGRELGDVCYAADGATLAEAVLSRAESAGLTLATAESCTGGMVGAALTEVPGASEAYLGGVVSYADSLKVAVIGVRQATLDAHGAVSEETAREMAEGVRGLTGADLAVAVTGIAGPEGGVPEKPVGTVWFALASADGTSADLRHFPGDRTTVRARATAAALDLLRRELPDRP